MHFSEILVCGLVLSLASCQENFDNRLEREAQEYTQAHCPQEPEKGTILDSITYTSSDRVYTLWYTLSPTNEQVISEHSPLLHQALLRKLIDDINYKELKDHGVTFHYIYHSMSNGKPVYETAIYPDEYKVRKN